MRRNPLIVAVAAALILVLSAAPALAGHRIQDSGRATISLESRGDAPEQAQGTADFRLVKRGNGAHQLTTTLRIRDLPERASRVFEVWLVDFDGHSTSLTAFNTDNDGDATVKTTRGIINMAPYDRIVVTEERRNGFNTEPSGEVVLSGSLH